MFRRWLPSFPASSGEWSETPLAAPAPPLDPESSGETKTTSIFIKLAASEWKTQTRWTLTAGRINIHRCFSPTRRDGVIISAPTLLQLTWITATRRAEGDKLKTNVTESEGRGIFSVFYQDLPAVQCGSVFAAQALDGGGFARHKFLISVIVSPLS